jgi:hypothetical protein
MAVVEAWRADVGGAAASSVRSIVFPSFPPFVFCNMRFWVLGSKAQSHSCLFLCADVVFGLFGGN